MIRREIKSFVLVADEERYDCTVPCTVREVLATSGTDTANIGRVSFESEIYADADSLKKSNFYIRIKGLVYPAKIRIGDTLVFEADGLSPIYNVNIGKYLSAGSNTLSISVNSVNVDDIGDVGLGCAVEDIRFTCAIIDGISLSQSHVDGGVSINIKLDLIGDTSTVRAVATLTSPVGQMYFAGLTAGKGTVTVPDPLYWWPVGQGVQNLYHLTVNLYGNDLVEDSIEATIGLRTAKMGNNGTVVVNGLNILPMGALYFSESDADTPEGQRRVECYINAAVMSNYNCLILPMGAPIPPDSFYQMCDKCGLMIIEEHSVMDLCDASAKHSIAKRSMHPSLCLIDLIDPIGKSPELKDVFDSLPATSFRIVRAQTEYLGLPSLPSMKTICEEVPEGERSLFSYSIERLAESGAIRNMLISVSESYPYPSDLSGFAYASAMASAHKVGDAMKNSRLSYGRTGRAVFNRLSDPRLAISASAIDSKGRWKPLQYYSARHFAPIAVYADIVGGSVTFSVSSQRRIDCIGNFVYRISDADNRTIHTASVECEIPGMSTSALYTVEIGEYIKGHEREYYLEYYIKEGSTALSRKTMLFVPEKHFAFKKPNLKAEINGQGKNFSITVSADRFVKDLEIGFSDVDAVFEDNYFDITSEAPIKICFTVSGDGITADRLKKSLELRSVVDLIK